MVLFTIVTDAILVTFMLILLGKDEEKRSGKLTLTQVCSEERRYTTRKEI